MTRKQIIETFEYRDGKLYWKIKPSIRTNIGDRAGSIDKNGYWLISCKKTRKEHRLIWEMFNGEIPEGFVIDHIDGDKLNNRIENLRIATRSQNRMNVGLSILNSSGYKGVHYCKRENRWIAQIRVNGKKKFLGQFKDIESAHKRYAEGAKIYHNEFANS